MEELEKLEGSKRSEEGEELGEFKEHGQFDRAMTRGRSRSVTAARVCTLEGLAAYTKLRRAVDEEVEFLGRGGRMCRRMGR